MPDENALRELREQRLGRTVKLCAAAHPFYRQRFRELGIGPEDIRTLDDLQRLPFVDKADYMACPKFLNRERVLATSSGSPPVPDIAVAFV